MQVTKIACALPTIAFVWPVLKENPDGSMPEEHEFARHNQHGYLYIKREVIPDLKEMGVADATIETLFVDNPRRFFRGS